LMGHVALRAFLSRVMVLHRDLLEPRRSRWIRFMAANAVIAGKFDRRDVRVRRVVLTDAMAAFARKGFVFRFGQLFQDVGVTLITGLLAGIDRRS